MTERSYYEDLIVVMSTRGFLMRREADGYQLVNEGSDDQFKISQPRGTDLYGITTNGQGRFVACEVKIYSKNQDRPRFSDFRESQKVWLSDVEKYGGVALVCYVEKSLSRADFCGWNSGNFTAKLFSELL
jgi:hypothetical protein